MPHPSAPLPRLARLTLAAALAAGAAACAARVAVPASTWRPVVAAHLARGDTLGAIAYLDTVAWGRPRDFSAIHELGMLAWSQARPYRSTSVGAPQEKIRLLRIADSSLRIAARSAPDSARFAVELGRFLQYGGMIQLRVQAEGWIERAEAAARRSGDARALGDALDELGMISWRSHENMARRRLLPAAHPYPGPGWLAGDMRRFQELAEDLSQPLRPIPGLDEAERAMERFREALRVAPWRRGPARHYAMALAEWDRWEELHTFAEGWVRGDPSFALAWAALGLSLQRTGRTAEAEAAFDSTLARLPAHERGRWTRVSRLTGRRDSLRYEGWTPEERAAFDRRFWQLADPVTLSRENEVRAEFLARVAFAELRWSSEDLDRHGADTDRGDIHVRFGPAPVRFTLMQGGTTTEHFWWYPERRQGFVFTAQVAYGTAYHWEAFRTLAVDVREDRPAAWDNVPVVATLDSVALQVTRFRGRADTTDVLVFAELPVERMAKGVELATGTMETRFTLLDPQGRVVEDTTSRETVRFARPDAASKRAFRARAAPGTHVVRVEGWQPTAGRAARGMAALPVGDARGFGTSDLLVADRIVPRDSAAASRWTDLRMVPSVGRLRPGQSFGVAWETYGLAARGGESRYEVTLELVLHEIDRSIAPERAATEMAKLRHALSRAVGRLGDVIGTTAVGDARIAITYQRARAATPVALEWLSLELGDAPLGRYELLVTVRDLVAGTRATTSRELRVVR